MLHHEERLAVQLKKKRKKKNVMQYENLPRQIQTWIDERAAIECEDNNIRQKDLESLRDLWPTLLQLYADDFDTFTIIGAIGDEILPNHVFTYQHPEPVELLVWHTIDSDPEYESEWAARTRCRLNSRQ